MSLGYAAPIVLFVIPAVLTKVAALKLLFFAQLMMLHQVLFQNLVRG